MKPQFVCYTRYEDRAAAPVTRARVAYLLRAARSRNCRRPGNVLRTRKGYFVRDCNLSIQLA